ncbi:MAG TPA: hypothetical protein VGY55_14735 [Pirellulales bacterium]|nr:hypothetical protein [Pirellulales bacterium]
MRNPALYSMGLFTAVVPTICLFFSVNMLFFVPLVVGLGCVMTGDIEMQATTKRRATLFGLIFCIAAAVGPFALAAYANRPGQPIRIVVPVGFRGEFSIVKNHAAGKELKMQDGVWVFEIPASGVLVVNDDYPFHMWHEEHVVYLDGLTARVEFLGTTAGSTDHDETSDRWKVVDAP